MIRRRLAAEDGVALVVAMMVVTLIGVFSAVMVQSALDVNDSSTRSRDSKRALAAAEAGMATALARLNRLAPGDHQCLADGPTEVLLTAQDFVRVTGSVRVGAGQCPPSSDERAGNGEVFSYHVTPALSATANGCNQPTGLAASASRSTLLASGLTVLERCVTVVGSAHGAVRRIQRRVFSTLRLFDGVTVDEELRVEPGVALGATRVRANDAVAMEGATYAGQIVRFRGAPEPAMVNVTGAWTTNVQDAPFPLAPIDPSPYVATNANATGIACVGPPVDALCTASPQPYDATERTLRVRSGYTVTLAPGDYHLCQVDVESGARLAVTGEVRLWIDDADRDGSPCAAGNGQVSIGDAVVNPAGALDAAGAAAQLRIHLVGKPGASALTVSGDGTTLVNALVYAPQSRVTVRRADEAGAGGPAFAGAVSARFVTLAGSGTTVTGVLDLPVSLDPPVLQPLYSAGDWVECQRKPTAGMPHSKCRGG